jgi:hypothetical protein
VLLLLKPQQSSTQERSLPQVKASASFGLSEEASLMRAVGGGKRGEVEERKVEVERRVDNL